MVVFFDREAFKISFLLLSQTHLITIFHRESFSKMIVQDSESYSLFWEHAPYISLMKDNCPSNSTFVIPYVVTMPLSENIILLITLLIKIHKPLTMASQNNTNLNYHQSYTVTGMNCVKFDDMIV
jgi:hypothetical protein